MVLFAVRITLRITRVRSDIYPKTNFPSLVAMVLPCNFIDLVFRRKEVSCLVYVRQRSVFDVCMRRFPASRIDEIGHV